MGSFTSNLLSSKHQQVETRSETVMDVDEPAGDQEGMDEDEYSSGSDTGEHQLHGLTTGYGAHQEGLISVFRMLVRNGQINVMSSDEEESDDDDEESEYLPEDKRRVRPPKEVYAPDLENIQKNDISFTMKDAPLSKLDGKLTSGLPNILMRRELGARRSIQGGFDTKQKANLLSGFLPNTVKKICNYGYKAFCGTYSKDGSIFLSASQDRAIRIYDTSYGRFQEMKKICARDVGWSVLDTAFSPDGDYVAYSSWSESIHICKIRGEEQHESLSLAPDSRRFCIFSIAFSENGSEILGGANDGLLYIFDRDRNQRVLKINAHDEDVNAVAFADETSQILFSVADDAIVKVWDRRCLNESEPTPVGVFAGHIDGITFVDSKQDGRYLITNSKDQSIKLWDLRVFSSAEAMGACRTAMQRNRWDYRWQRVPQRLCMPREVVRGDTSIMTYRGHSVLNTLIRCRFSPPSTNQKFVYTGCAAGRVVIYDLLTGQIVKALDGHTACVRDVSWHPDYPEIVSTSWDGSVGHWTCESQHSLSAEDAEILGINTNPELYPRRSSRLAAKTVSTL